MDEQQQHSMIVGQTFPWHEANVADPAKAVAFYGKVLGYGTMSMPMGEMGDYHMLTKDGLPVAGIMATVGEFAHVPPHWAVYMAVADVDAAINLATEAGGTVVVPAMDIPDIGRMALLCCDQGAHFWVYKSVHN